MSAKHQSTLICTLLTVALSGCQKQKTAIFLDTAWNQDFAKNACEISEKNHQIACFQGPEQIANELRVRFLSAFQQTPACKDVSINSGPLNAGKLNEHEAGWSLSFNIGLENGEIDYPFSEWQIIDNKTLKRFSAGTLKDMNQADDTPGVLGACGIVAVSGQHTPQTQQQLIGRHVVSELL